MVLYLIPAFSFAALLLWSWLLVETLREERDYFWLVFMILAPPLGIPVYLLNFRVLGDEQRGLTAIRRRMAALKRIDVLKAEISESDIVGRREELATHYLELGMWEECLEQLKHVMAFDAESPRVQLQAATALVNLGRNAEALPHLEYIFEEAMDLYAYRGAILYGKTLDNMGRLPDAITAYRAIQKRFSPPEVVYILAEALHRSGQKDEAVTLLKDLLNNHGDDAAETATDRHWLATARRFLQKLEKG